MPKRPEDCGFRYTFVSADAAPVGVTFPHRALADSVLDALADVLAKGIMPIATRDVAEEGLKDLMSHMRGLEQQITVLVSDQQNLMSAISSGDVTGGLLREINAQYELRSQQLEQLQSQHDQAQLEMDRQRQVLDRDRARRKAEDALIFICQIRDPHSRIAQQFFTTCIQDLRFELQKTEAREKVLAWSGVISLSAKGSPIAVPFSGRWKCDRASGPLQEWALERLMVGQSLRCDVVSRRFEGGTADKIATKEILPAIGLTKEEGWIAYVGDDALLKAYLAIYATNYKGASWNDIEEALREDFGEPNRLRGRLERTHDKRAAQKRRHWINARSRDETQALIAQAVGESIPRGVRSSGRAFRKPRWAEDWDFIDGSWTSAACPTCGSRRRVRLLIDEPAGYVCYDCRTDPDGIRWPQRFDRFIAFPELWISAGFALELPAEASPRSVSRRYSKRRERLDRLDQSTFTAIIARYQSGDEIKVLVSDFGLQDIHDVYRILDDHRIPRRSRQRPKRARISPTAAPSDD